MPDRPARSLVAIPTELSGPLFVLNTEILGSDVGNNGDHPHFGSDAV